MHEQAKANERWWARYFGGTRHASQGVEHPDVSGLWFTLEHKYRDWSSYSAEFRKAISQMDANSKMFPHKIAMVGLSLHQGRGKKTRRLLVYEVTEETFEEELNKIRRVMNDTEGTS